MSAKKTKKNTLFLDRILKEIDNKLKLKKQENISITEIVDLVNAKKNHLAFCSTAKYINFLIKTKASAVIVQKKFAKYVPKKTIAIISKYPELDFAKISNLLYPESYFSKITYTNLDFKTIEGKYKTLKFGVGFYLEENVKIGSNVFIGNNVTIKKNCKIGNHVIIGSNVVIENSLISDNVHICDGSIIGKKGFGFKFIKGKCLRIPHVGKVIIGKECEIGSNCVIDRGSVKNTTIGEKTFLDNFVHIAHNVTVGKRCIFAAQVGVAGSTTIGDNVIIGGQAGISGHLTIGNNVKIGGKSGVVKNIKDNETVMGYPAKPFREFIKENK
jgi:UDP-3-O-[3-hydroxymyristoyl] glucosamine N-acyltransferase